MTYSMLPLAVALGLLGLAACDEDGDEFDVSQQIGPDPVLPEPQQPLLASVKAATLRPLHASRRRVSRAELGAADRTTTLLGISCRWASTFRRSRSCC